MSYSLLLNMSSGVDQGVQLTLSFEGEQVVTAPYMCITYEYLRYGTSTAALHHLLTQGGVGIHINSGVFSALAVQQGDGTGAERAPACQVNSNFRHGSHLMIGMFWAFHSVIPPDRRTT